MADRRNWSIAEEDALIIIRQEIVAAGGRSDNGCFRTGTYEKIVLKMREKIPGLNITSKHIQNKMKRLKDKYSATYDMLNTSGFGWNDAHQCIAEDAQVLEEYLKKHPSKNYIANKPFPQYQRLKTIFGKDRAKGSLTESAADAILHSTRRRSVIKKEKEKISVADNVNKMIEKGLNAVSEEMGKLVSVVGTLGLQTMSNELKKMGFDHNQCVAISMYFVDNLIQLRLWNGMNDEFKPSFVTIILQKLGM